MATPKEGRADPLRFKAWLAQLEWSTTHSGAWEELVQRCSPQDHRAFVDTWPPPGRVEAWLDAAFADNALACAGRRERALQPAYASALLLQVKRGWGWSDSTSAEHELSDRDSMRFHATIVAALAGEWDLVAAMLGSRPLARKVVAAKTYGRATFGGLVRHVATAAKAHLGEGSCQAALKAWAEDRRCRPGPLLALGCLAIEGAGGHPRSEVASRLEQLLTSAAPAPLKTSRPLVDDVKASVFERYLPVLGDAKALANAKSSFSEDHVNTEWLAHAWLLGLDELVTRALLKPERPDRTLPNASLVASACLGRAAPGWRETQREALAPLHSPREVGTLSRYRWSTQVAAIALAAGDTKLVLKLTVGSKKETFKPGKAFGEDARRTLRYLALALDAGATQADVTPAWLELLVARAPSSYDDTLAGGAWGWASLLCVAYVYFHVLGGTAEAEVGLCLRDTLRGVR